MKIIFLLAAFIYSFSQVQAQDTAKLIFYRPSSWSGSAMRVKLSLGDQKIKLKNKHLVEVIVPVGDYNIENQRRILFARKSHYLLSAEPNKTYYFRYRYISNFFYSIDEFVLVDEAFAKKEIARTKLKTK